MSGKIERYARELAEKAERLEIPTRIEEAFASYRNDPVRFARDVLRVERIPRFQAGVLRDVAKHERTAWVAGHAVGKSHAAAMLIAWYLLTRPGCRGIVTSATYERQVGRVIFAKLRTLLARAREPLPIEVTATRAQVVGHPEWSFEGVPSTRPGNFAGYHASRMLVIADEAKALDRPVFEELHGTLASATEEARLLLISTAGPAQGYFYECFSRRAELWKLHRTPSTESPFAEGFAERMREETLGETDPVYAMRVLAEFQEDVEGQLIPLSAIQAATDRRFPDSETDEEVLPVLGCDIARYGEDRTVVCVRRGRKVAALKAWRGADTMRTAERIQTEFNARGARRAFVDEIGVGGGPVDRLLQLGVAVDPVNVSRASRKADTFSNLRAELAWRLRERFERSDISIPDDTGLASELAALRYTYDAKGRIALESKDAAKARLGRSPDLADAVMLAFAQDAKGASVEVDAAGFAAANAEFGPPDDVHLQACTCALCQSRGVVRDDLSQPNPFGVY